MESFVQELRQRLPQPLVLHLVVLLRTRERVMNFTGSVQACLERMSRLEDAYTKVSIHLIAEIRGDYLQMTPTSVGFEDTTLLSCSKWPQLRSPHAIFRSTDHYSRYRMLQDDVKLSLRELKKLWSLGLLNLASPPAVHWEYHTADELRILEHMFARKVDLPLQLFLKPRGE